MRTRPSSHGPPPSPPRTGMPTAFVTASPATGPEFVKSSSAAPHRAAREDHLVERDLQLRAASPQVDADRVADRQHVGAGAIRDRGELAVVHDDGDDLPVLALHLLQRGNRHVFAWGFAPGPPTRHLAGTPAPLRWR